MPSDTERSVSFWYDTIYCAKMTLMKLSAFLRIIWLALFYVAALAVVIG